MIEEEDERMIDDRESDPEFEESSENASDDDEDEMKHGSSTMISPASNEECKEIDITRDV